MRASGCITILPLSTSFFVCEAFGWETGVNKKFSEAPQFYSLYSVLIIIGCGLIMVPKAPLIPIMLISQVINGIMLPFILIFMILLVNNKKLMGGFINSRTYNYLAWGTVIIVSAIGLVMLFTTFL